MAEQELKIKVKADVSELTKLKREIKEAEDALLKAAKGEGQFANDIKRASDNLKQKQQALLQARNSLKEYGLQTRQTTNSLLRLGESATVVAAGLKVLIAGFINYSKQTALSGAELKVLRDNFQGTAKDLELFNKATAGTVTEANLIKLSNQANDLGISLKDQALLFSLAEDAADKYGGGVEENFMRVVLATEGNIKGLKSLGIQKAQYEQTVKDMVKAIGGEIEINKDLHGEQEITIKNLDAETQKRIRTEAILKLTGVTLQDVNKKTADQKDRLEQVSIRLEEYQQKLGLAFGEDALAKVDKFSEGLKNLGYTEAEAKRISDELTKSIGGGLLDAFMGFPIALIVNNFDKITKVIQENKFWIDLALDSIRNLSSALSGKFYLDIVRRIFSEGELPPTDEQLSGTQMDMTYRGFALNDKDEHKPIIDLKNKKSGSGAKKEAQELTTAFDELQKKLAQSEAELTKLFTQGREVNGVWEAFTESTNAIKDQRSEIAKLKKEIDELFKAPFGTNIITATITPIEDVFKMRELPDYIQKLAGQDSFRKDQKLRDREEFDELLPKTFNSLESAFKDFANILDVSGDTFFGKVLQAGETFSSIVSLIFKIGETASMFNRLLGLLPFIGGLFGGGAIGARAEGGEVTAGQTYLVGERGMELFKPNVSGYIYNNDELRNFANNSMNRSIGNMVSNIYLNASINNELIVRRGTKAMNSTNRMKRVA